MAEDIKQTMLSWCTKWLPILTIGAAIIAASSVISYRVGVNADQIDRLGTTVAHLDEDFMPREVAAERFAAQAEQLKRIEGKIDKLADDLGKS